MNKKFFGRLLFVVIVLSFVVAACAPQPAEPVTEPVVDPVVEPVEGDFLLL